LVNRSVGRTRGSHTNIMLPLQFCYPGPPFPTLLRPVGHPQNSLKFWLVGWSVSWSVGWSVSQSVGQSRGSHTNVTLPLQFFHPGPPFLTLLRPAGQPQNDLKFWSVDRSVGRSWGSHTNVMLPLQFRQPGQSFLTLLCPAGHPQNGLKFWLVGRSQGSHTNVTLLLQFRHPGPPFPTLLRPAGHPQNGPKFWLVGRLVGHGEVTQTSRCLFSFVTRARPSRPFYALQATPKTALDFG
jgi:hypothetical protein